jgi:hypothetical protein
MMINVCHLVQPKVLGLAEMLSSDQHSSLLTDEENYFKPTSFSFFGHISIKLMLMMEKVNSPFSIEANQPHDISSIDISSTDKR